MLISYRRNSPVPGDFLRDLVKKDSNRFLSKTNFSGSIRRVGYAFLLEIPHPS